ncbi:MAG: PQQ-binding-like beta-propeller repeat protein [Roseimicrobium sp.]
MNPRILTALLMLALTASITLHAQDTTAPQSWTASDGRVMQAKFIKLDGDSVVIEKDGKQFAVSFTKLSAESVALAKKLGGVLPKVPPPSPSAAATQTAIQVPDAILPADSPLQWQEYHTAWSGHPCPRLGGAPNGNVLGAFEVKADRKTVALEVACHAAADGSELWRVSLPGDHKLDALQVDAQGNVLLLGNSFRGNRELESVALLLSAKDGKEQWRWLYSQGVLASITFTSSGDLVVATAESVSLIQNQTGKTLWKVGVETVKPGKASIQDAVLVGSEAVVGIGGFFGAKAGTVPPKFLFRLNLADGRAEWVKDCPENLLLTDDYLASLFPQHQMRRISVSPKGIIHVHATNGIRQFAANGDSLPSSIGLDTLRLKSAEVKNLRFIDWDQSEDMLMVVARYRPYDYELQRISAETGAVVWQINDRYEKRYAPVPIPGRAFWMVNEKEQELGIAGRAKTIALLDTTSGKPVWEKADPFGKVEAVSEMVAAGDNAVICLKPLKVGSIPSFHLLSGKDGSLIWSKAWGAPKAIPAKP